jgi:hypothetical protein
MKTFTVPSGVAGSPSACSSAPDRIDLFAVGAGAFIWRWSFDGANWLAPQPLPPIGVIPAEGLCAISSGPGRVEVFAAERGTQSPAWWRGNSTTWTHGNPPTLIPGAQLPAVPLAAVASSPDDIDVFGVGAAKTPFWWHWNGTVWTPPVRLPDGANLPPVRLAAVSPAPGRLDVFGVGGDRRLWHWSKAGTGKWSLKPLGGNLPALGVSAVSWGPNRIDVFAASREPGNPVQHWWSDGGTFAGPETLGSNFAAGSVSAVSHGTGRLDVFGVTGDQRIGHLRFDGSGWQPQSHHGDRLPAGDVCAVVRAPHKLDVFAVGSGNTIRKWPGGGLENATTEPWVNWPMNQSRNPLAGHLRPDSLEELVNIVQEAERLGRGVRALGSSWSNSDVAVPPHYAVETDRLNRFLTDVLANCSTTTAAGRRLVHVEGGIKLAALNEWLDGRGMALSTMGGSSGQSLAGVVSTSAHGMDLDRGPIPDMVRAIHLVGPGGAQHWIEPKQMPGAPAVTTVTDAAKLATWLGIPAANIHYDDDWFYSVLVSMGSMGIIYSLIIEVDEQYDLIDSREVLDWTVMRQRLRDGGGRVDRPPFDGNRGVQVAITPYPKGDGSRAAYLTNRVQARPATTRFSKTNYAPLLGFVTPGLFSTWSVDRSTLDDIVTELTARDQSLPSSIRGWGHSIMGGPDPGPVKGRTVAFTFDATSLRYLDFVDAVLEMLKTAYYDSPQPLGYPGWISLRYQGRSRAYLSMHNRSPLNVTVECAAAWRMSTPGVAIWHDTVELIRRIEVLGRQFGGIQHWGLNEQIDFSDVKRAYPKLDVWRKIRWQLTNNGRLTTFDNEFTRRCGLSNPPADAAKGDYDFDGKTDFAVWRPSTGLWWIINSSTGIARTLAWGLNGDIPVPGDYSGDGKVDFAVWRPSNATWYVIDSATGAQRTQQWGQPGDVPVPGDYDGDGKMDFAVWRPSTGTWYVIDSSTGVQREAQWGLPGDVPVPGRYDSDSRDDFAVWRPSTGQWWIINTTDRTIRMEYWGLAGDVPVPADYDNDGKTDFAVWRPSNGTWYTIESSTGLQRARQWGQPGDVPVPGRYDNDAAVDLAVWRPSNGTWYVIDSATGAQRTQQWGTAGDVPVAHS